MQLTKGEQTVGRILDAAEEAFAAKGYGGASMRDIAAAAKVTSPALYRYFESKESLHAAVLRRVMKPLGDVLDKYIENARAGNPVQAMPGEMLDVLSAHPNIANLMMQHLFSAQRGAEERPDLDSILEILHKATRFQVAAGMRADDLGHFLIQVAFSNLTLGFGWAAAVYRLLNKRTEPKEMQARYKELLGRVMLSLVIPPNAQERGNRGAASARRRTDKTTTSKDAE